MFTKWRCRYSRLVQYLILVMGVLIALSSSPLSPAHALTAEEQLTDSVLENRARALFVQLRCLVCQNQSIVDSEAELAVDLRGDVRTMLLAGTDDVNILADIQQRYGEYILMRPPVTRRTGLLWGLPALFLATAFFVIWVVMRRPTPPNPSWSEPLKQIRDTGTDKVLKDASISLPQLIGLTVICLTGTIILYLYLGEPETPSAPLASRASELQQAETLQLARQQQAKNNLDKARAVRDATPEDIETILRFALAAGAAEAHDEEISALKTALSLSNQNPAIKSLLADARYRQAGRFVTLPIRALIDEILEDRPDDVRALFLYGLAAYQDEDYTLAMSRFEHLLSLTQPDAPWSSTLTAQIKQTANKGGLPLPAGIAGPDFDDIASAAELSEEDRSAMILSMVEQLETRLMDEPGDLAGWLKLARAKEQLGLQEEAFYATVKATELSSRPAIILQALEIMLYLGDSNTSILETSKELVSQLSRTPAYEAEALFFGGHLDVLKGAHDTALSQWRQLLGLLPEESDAAASLRHDIRQLENKQK